MTSPKSPGKAYREGITLMELAEMFPNEESALKWFEERFWPNGRFCGHCSSTNTREASHAKMPYWCTDCRSYFSIKTGTFLEYTQLPLHKWVYAIHLHVTNLKGISSMKAASGEQGFAADGVVHAAAHPQGIRRQRRR